MLFGLEMIAHKNRVMLIVVKMVLASMENALVMLDLEEKYVKKNLA